MSAGLRLRLIDPFGQVIGEADLDVSAAVSDDAGLSPARLVNWTGIYRHTSPANPQLASTVEVSER